jgi:hypothetical protein
MIENNTPPVPTDANDETASDFKTVHLALDDLVHEPKSLQAGKPSAAKSGKGMVRTAVAAKFDVNGDDVFGS